MSATSIPVAPKIPISVVLRQWSGAMIIIDENTSIEDVIQESGPDWIEVPEEHSSITLWNYKAPFALLPYIDLPYEVLNKRGMAVITSDGRRGWVIYDMAVSPMASVPIDPKDCPDFIASLEDNHWEVIPMKAKEVDQQKHFAKRADDGSYDFTADVIWDGKTCEWCGHPLMKDHEGPCEACDAEPQAYDGAGVVKMDNAMPSIPEHQREDWA